MILRDIYLMPTIPGTTFSLRAATGWALALLAGVSGALLLGGAHDLSAEPVRTEHAAVELIAEHNQLPANGGTVTLGWMLAPDEGRYVFWKNPGEAGKQPEIRWSLPAGFAAGDLQFPAPRLIPFGDLSTYGLEGAALLLLDLTVPGGLIPGEEVTLRGSARWVVCDGELCVPERGRLSVTLTVGEAGLNPDAAEQFAAARAQLPQKVEWPAFFELSEGRVRLEIAPPRSAGAIQNAYLYLASQQLAEYSEQVQSFTPRGVAFSMPAATWAERATESPAVLQYSDPDGAMHSVALTVSKASGALAEAFPEPPPMPVAGASGAAAFGQALLFAFLGGLILNLMPCVFPILSIKALSLVKLSQGEARIARDSGVFYALGIVLAFLAVGGTLVALRLTGQAVGWGFQMQSPLVNTALALLMVAISLNLLGVYSVHIRLPGRAAATASGSERRSAFLSGLLAVMVATPCMAPFMAGALGYSLAQPPLTAMLVFLTLGLGLAFPYVLLSWLPAVGRWLPRPGPWMENLRNILAFPMLATALWLLWVVGAQLGVNAMAVVLAAILLLSFSLMCLGRFSRPNGSKAWGVACVLTLTLSLGAALQADDYAERADPSGAQVAKLGQLEPKHFTPEAVLANLQAQQPTFVYFTADWCLSCKVNERVALSTDEVGEAFAGRGIDVFEGDWTKENPDITAWLERYGRIGVPLYLYFPRGAGLDTAAILPQILTPGIVIEAIDAADQSRISQQ